MRKITMQAGSAAWITSRSASKAPAMMGCDPTISRTELIHMMATGLGKEFSDWQQKHLLDKGHVSEIGARALAEEVVGEDFVPSSAETDDGYLTAAPDGATFGNGIGLEAKLWNEKLAAAVRSCDLPPAKYWQLEQQILVYGFDYVLFVVSDGTPDKFVSMEYRAVPGRAEQLMAGWRQMDKDVEEYKRKLAAGEIEQPKEMPKAEVIQALPSVYVQATGMVTASNLAEFKEAATSFIAAIKTELVSDEDFANAEATVKFCKEAETNLEATKASVLAQMSSVDEVVRTLDHIKKQLADKRLTLDKLVKYEKEARKLSIVSGAINEFNAHIAALEVEIKPIRITGVKQDFAGAIAGLKSLKSMQDKVGTALANAKIALDTEAADIRKKLAWCKENAAGKSALFPDLQAIIVKPYDDFTLLITSRIEKQKADEAARLEAERAAMLAEEERKATAKAQAEAEAILAAERAKQAAEEAAARTKAAAEIKEYEEANGEMKERGRGDAASKKNPQSEAGTLAGAQPSAVSKMEPAAPIATTAPASVSEASGARLSRKQTRPTRDDMINAIADTYDVDHFIALEWLEAEFAEVAA